MNPTAKTHTQSDPLEEYAEEQSQEAWRQREARKKTAKAHRDKLRAEQMRRRALDDLNGPLPPANPERSLCDLSIADAIETEANACLALPDGVIRGTGGELTASAAMNLAGIEDAVKRPDRVTLQASIQRAELAEEAGVLDLAFDAAESVGAANTIERMLAHQMAAAHKAALGLVAKADRQRDTVEQARLINASVRLMTVCQQGALTLQRLRTGGNQTVTVQHVTVADGGQAVIGKVETGGRRRPGEDENHG